MTAREMILNRGVAAGRALDAYANRVAGNSSWKDSVKSVRNYLGSHLNRAGLEQERFTVLSNDCWAQALYDDFGLPNQTPMVGCGMHADHFLRFLSNVEGYLKAPIEFISDSRNPSVRRLRSQRHPWPVGLLNGDVLNGDVLNSDVEVQFIHYDSESEARLAWERGCASVSLDRIYVKFSADKNGATHQHIERFAALPFERKLLISAHRHPGIDCAVHAPDYVLNGAFMFRRSLKYFDCAHWLNTGQVRRNSARVMLNKLLYVRGA